jgi:peroxiredoxin Q/BCP
MAVHAHRESVRLRWLLLLPVPVLAGLGVVLYLVLRPSSPAATTVTTAATTWAAGAARAPNFHLADADGNPVSLAALRGGNVIVTFVDPKCTTFCPRESLVLNDAIRMLPAAERPAIVAVNVNPPVRDAATLHAEARRFRWLPQWRWAVGTDAKLQAVWRAYRIAVMPAKGDIIHTEAAYVVDARGDQRALFLWPFRARDVAAELRQLR